MINRPLLNPSFIAGPNPSHTPRHMTIGSRPKDSLPLIGQLKLWVGDEQPFFYRFTQQYCNITIC